MITRACGVGLAWLAGCLLLATQCCLGQEAGDAAEEDASPLRTAKCGRDCAYLACRFLGVEADVDEIDRALGGQLEVSLADMRRVLEDKGLFCHGVALRSGNIGRLAEVVGGDNASVAAIAALPREGDDAGHFVVVLNATDESFTFLNPSDGNTYAIELSALPEDLSLPVLLVGRDESVRRCFTFGWGSLAATARRFFSSWMLSAGLLLTAAVYQFSRPMARWATWSVAWVCCGLAAAVCLLRRLFGLRRVRIVLAAACACALVITGVVLLMAPPPQPLTVEPAELDLGRVALGSKQSLEFRVSNSGAETYEIDEVKASCSCLDVEPEAKVLEPGKSTTVRLSLMVVAKGRSEIMALLTPKEKSMAATPLRVGYTGYESVRLYPTYFNAGDFSKGALTECTVAFRVDNFEGPPVPLATAMPEGDDPVLNVSLVGPAELSKGGTFELQLSCDGKRPLGQFTQKIVVTTAEADTEARSFVVTAYGMVVAPLRVEPASVFLSRDASGQGVAQPETITIQSLTTPFEVVSASCDSDAVSVGMEEDSTDERRRTVLVSLTPGFQGAAASTVLSIVTTHPQGNDIEVPVFVGIPSADD